MISALKSRCARFALVSFTLTCTPLAFAAAPTTDAYPVRPIRFIVPWAPGGGGDIAARVLQVKLAEALGQPVVIDNRPGAGGNIGAELAAKSRPDGYTILFGAASTHVMNPNLYAKMPFRETDFAPVSQIATVANILVVNPTFPAKTVGDLIARAKAGPVFFGSSGNGSVLHVAAEMFDSMAHVRMTHVPYKGGGPAIAAILGNEVQVLFSDPLPAIPLIKESRLRALAVMGVKRLATFPELPTIAESGVPGYDADSWAGLFTPAGIPDYVMRRLNQECVRALQMLDVRERFANNGYTPTPSSPEQFAGFVSAQIAKWGAVIKAANIRIE
jgi:tripartite-type tricarboxylate transporter receptor subunit TctC